MTKSDRYVLAEYEYRKHVANDCDRCEDANPDPGCPDRVALWIKRERAYTEALEIVGMTLEDAMGECNIGWAVMQMKEGKKVRRAGWNGKGMWLVLMPELNLPPHSSQSPGAKVNDRTAKHIGVDTPLNSQPYIAMWTAQGLWQPGWLCSQADLLATDWELVS